MLKLAVAGNPIAHSLSPELYKSSGLELSYIRIQTDSPKKLIKYLKDNHFDGCNLTAPLKEKILPYLDYQDEESRWIQASNTIKFQDGKLYGYNTDPVGIIKSLESFELEDKNVIIIGSGGACKSAIYALHKLKAKVYISSRNDMKVKHLKDVFNINVVPWTKLHTEISKFKAVISTVPDIMDIGFDLDISKEQIFLDANYKVAHINAYPNRINGLTWLKAQAEKSLEIFSGKKTTMYLDDVHVSDGEFISLS